jgi:hypothetical protein
MTDTTETRREVAPVVLDNVGGSLVGVCQHLADLCVDNFLGAGTCLLILITIRGCKVSYITHQSTDQTKKTIWNVQMKQYGTRLRRYYSFEVVVYTSLVHLQYGTFSEAFKKV